jgi:WD40 repeat protein/nucleoside phosphorylase
MSRAQVDVLIVTALKDELDAVLELEIDGKSRAAWMDARDQSGFRYHTREISNEHGETLRLAAGWSGLMGESAAAVRAVGLIQELNPACLAMCGICAGRRGSTFLGDIIVADRVFNYDHGKLFAGTRERDTELFHDITTYNLAAEWRMDAEYLAAEFTRDPRLLKARPLSMESQRRWLLRALDVQERSAGPSPIEHPERKSRCPDWGGCIQSLRRLKLIKTPGGVPFLTEKGRTWVREELLLDPDGQRTDPPCRVHVAPIATGKLVQEDPELFNRLSRHVRKVLGAEMEATAISFVAEQLGRRSIIVKAVADHADLDKDDAYRSFACHASAAFLLAFIRRYFHPAVQEPVTALIEEGQGSFEDDEGGEGGRAEFFARVERVSLLHEPAGTKIIRRPARPPFGMILEIAVPEGRQFTRVFPVAALNQPITEELLEVFIQHVHESYHRENPSVVSRLVYIGSSAPPALVQKAETQRVELISFAEYLGLIDFSSYLQQQTARLERDPVYPPTLYVEQEARVNIGGQETAKTHDVLAMLLELLRSPHPRFALVLGDSGAGKTFLLHELARRMGQGNPSLIPILIEMRSLQKQRTLRQLIAQHFAAAEVTRFEMERFLCMLREGRIVLLFDSFDELAVRVTYDRVMEHFGTLIEAAQGKAKVVITSRTQHFLTDHEVKRELAQRAEALPGYRLIKLEQFDEMRIHGFLTKRLGGESAAQRRLALLRSIRDLLGLAENPRLLGFIADLDEQSLRGARTGSGEITAAKIYELLINRWLEGEYQRVNPAGAPKGLSVKQLWGAATELAMVLWGRTERSVGVSELPEELITAVGAWGEHSLDAEVIRHQLGSGTLLVRDDDGRISFVHQSVLEWLVAEAAAKELSSKGGASILGRREVSDLMADFLIQLAGQRVVRTWAEARSAKTDDFAKRNALRLLSRLPKRKTNTKDGTGLTVVTRLKGSDLRGQNLSDVDLRRAQLQDADLSGATLVKTDITEAHLKGARLARADLVGARLQRADLADADLSWASLLGADLRGAVLRGAKLRATKLTGAKIDSLDGSDTFGAALPNVTKAESNFGLASSCYAVAFSPGDPSVIATGHGDGSIRIWDVVTGRPLRVLYGHTEPVRSVAFSPDGALLAAASNDWTLTIWDVGTGTLHHDLRGHDGPVLGVVFSPDGSLLASASADRTLNLWSVDRGDILRTFHGHTGYVRSVVFSPGGAMLASGSADGTAILWSVGQGEILHVLRGHEDHVRSVAFSPDSMMLATGSTDRTLILWTVGWGQPLRVLRGHAGSVFGAAFSPDGKTLGSSSEDQTIILWSVDRGEPLRVLKRHSGPVAGLAFNKDGNILASGSSDRSIILWDVAQGIPSGVLRGPVPPIFSMVFSQDGLALACSSKDQTLVVWSMLQGRPQKVLKGHPGNIKNLAISSAHKNLVAAAYDNGSVWVWDASRGEVVSTFKGLATVVRTMAFSVDGLKLATTAGDRTITVWDLASWDRLCVLKGHSADVLGIAFSPDGETIASASEDKTVLLWNLSQESVLGVLQGHSDQVRAVAFSPNGEWVASASSDETLILWHLREEEHHLVLRGHVAPVLSVAFSPDGTLLASGSADRTVTLWRVKDGQSVRMLQGHAHSIVSVAFILNGAVLVAASNDGIVCFWDVETGARLATLMKFPDGWASFRPDGRFRSGGDTGGAFWHSIGLCRFEPGELDPYLPTPLRLPDTEPLLSGA